MTNPIEYGRTVTAELFQVPLSQRKLNMNKKMFEDCSSNGGTEPVAHSGQMSRLDILLNDEDMEEEGFPLSYKISDKTKKYVNTREKGDYRKPTSSSPMFSVDCEMVESVSHDGEKIHNELAWVAITDETGKCILNEIVKPRNRIVNCRTWVSGIKRETFKDVKTRIEDIQKRIQELLPPDAILVGQSLNGDMHALQMCHPYVIDTSVIYNLSGRQSKKPGLKYLTHKFLHRNIQMSSEGHNPCEDAQAAMDLVLLKLKHGISFGNVLWGWCESSVPGPSDKETSITNGSGGSGSPSLTMETTTTTKNNLNHSHNTAPVTSVLPAYRDFFELAREQNKSVAIGGFGDTLPPSLGSVKLNAVTDRHLVYQCREALTNNFMVCAQFNACSTLGSVDQSSSDEALRGKADKRIRKVMKSVGKSTLCIVVLNSSRQNDKAVCHLKIT